MPEVFLSNLPQVRLFDMLKPLLLGKKTGILSIRGREIGEIFLEMGSIVHARVGHTSGEDAFNLIMGLRNGKCSFESDVLPPERTISISTEQLLLNWSYRKQEWEQVQKIVSSTAAIFRLCPQTGSEDMNIKADQWKVLALTNGMRTVAEVAELLKWDEFRTSRIIFQLVQNGLLEKGEEPKAVGKKLVSEDFFPAIAMELKRAMGPVAPLIIEDKLADFKETENSFPQDRAEMFIEALSDEIPNQQKRMDFINTAKEFLSPEEKRDKASRLPGVDVKF